MGFYEANLLDENKSLFENFEKQDDVVKLALGIARFHAQTLDTLTHRVEALEKKQSVPPQTKEEALGN